MSRESQPAIAEPIDPNRTFSPTGLVFVLLLGSVLSWRAQFFVPGPNTSFAAPAEPAQEVVYESVAPASAAPAPISRVQTEPDTGELLARLFAREAPAPTGLPARTVAPATGEQYALEAAGSHAIEATLSVDVQTSPFSADEWVVFAAQPPNLPAQTGVSARLSPDGEAYLEPAPPHRRLLRARLNAKGADADPHHLRVRVDYRATLIARRLVVREAGKSYLTAESLSPAQRETYLAADELIDYRSPAFQAWLRTTPLASRGKLGDVDFGRRVFLHLKKTLVYEYTKEMDRQASHICRAGRSDCAGMSLLFVATLRSHGIPARVLAGRWARSSHPDQMVGQVKYFQQHVRAEFYAAGVGWVPVDLSSAIERDFSPDGLQFFGQDRGDFFVLHVDPRIRADTVHFGQKTLNWLQGIQYWVSGHGKYSPGVLTETWRVEPVVQRNPAPSIILPRTASR